MKNGIFIPASVVRLAVGALAVAVTAIVVAELPEAWRYYKMETM
ncbi:MULTISPECIES: DUF6893 family small protein [Streptomyces]|uniref:Uncharacterized protein n=1 Tax=Streptomyces chengmaiensis TaxID=3040919 RepID=A0ABT6HQ44_9ACTN|nr:MULTISPECIES: hypothetical protein [Streptomyces]MDH2390839.1 hypothetical protein [Streptomyces chengmaiensis]WRQ80109.1 hypothetical protein I3F59_012520 [Streptomyces sp. MUM 178J]